MPAREITRIQELIHELRVGDVMKQDVIKIAPSTPMRDLRAILRDNRISGTPVVADGRLIGIVSIEDFIKWLAEGGPDCGIADRMTTDVTTIFEDEPLVQAANKLERFGFGRMPVIRRKTGELVGVITKGDIVTGLLMKLDIDYRHAEMRDVGSGRLFQDIVADDFALTFEYEVAGGDFSRAGASASGLKTTLLRLGVPPQTARRAAIAAYEAEMNLIVFTDGGQIIGKIGPTTIRLVVKDDGPGIPDIEQAMQPGFSTAPDWVRELGFGAGMGLQNIKTCADRMNLSSTAGKGTHLEVDILLEREGDPGRDHTEA